MERTERKTVQFKGKGEPGLCSEVSLLYRSHAARPWHGYQNLKDTHWHIPEASKSPSYQLLLFLHQGNGNPRELN